jgi:hypothetical protein
MRVAPGTMLDGAILERHREAMTLKGSDNDLLIALTVALGLLLAIPSGGTSMVASGVVLAGEVTLLAADLYLLGKDFEEREVFQQATNTDMSVADSLLQEEPAAGPLIFRILGILGPGLGAAGVAKAGSQLARVAQAREGIEAVRAVRSAATAVSGELSHPDVVAASARLRTIAREVGMTDEEIEALIRNVGRGAVTGTHAANAVGAALDTTAPLTDDVADALARQLGVPRIRRTGEATRTVGVAPTMVDGRVVVDEIVAGDLATVGDVLAHAETVARVKRYDGIVGKVRETWDALAEAVGAAPRMNPHTPFTAAHEAFEEVRKYEAMLRRRIGDLAAELGRGGDDAAKAAARIEDEILVMEGELAHYREVLDEVKHTGDLGAARGLIEAKDVGKVTDEAIAAGYPALPSDDYFYRRWPGRGPEGQEFQVVRKNTAVDAFQPRKDPATGKWVLGESEEVSRVPKSFAAAMTDDEVVQAMLVESKSAKAIVDALINKVGAVDSDVYARAATAVKKVRTPRGMVTDDVADGVRRVTDEDNLRHALKAEFKEDFFTAASREVTPEAQMKRFRDLTEDLNPADSGNMMEDFLARRDPGSVRHVEVDQGKLAGQKPPVTIAQDRQIDRVRPDGTAIECKSGAGALSDRELKQLDDYRTMQAGAIVDVNGTPTTVKQVLYEFTDPAGVVANLDTIANRMLDKGIHVKVYNASGQDRTLTTVDDLGDLLDWLRQ